MRSQRTFFDERADAWEENCYPPPVRKRLETLLSEFGVKTGERVLHLGTGPGILIPYLHALTGHLGKIAALDISHGMLLQAQKKIHPLEDWVIQATALYLPLKDESFDRVICFAAFPHFGDRQKALDEMARVLRPGGSVVIAHLLNREELAAHHQTHAEVKNDILPDEDQMRLLLEKAGFCNVSITDIPGRYLSTAKKR